MLEAKIESLNRLQAQSNEQLVQLRDLASKAASRIKTQEADYEELSTVCKNLSEQCQHTLAQLNQCRQQGAQSQQPSEADDLSTIMKLFSLFS